jgi:hypothetical protein
MKNFTRSFLIPGMVVLMLMATCVPPLAAQTNAPPVVAANSTPPPIALVPAMKPAGTDVNPIPLDLVTRPATPAAHGVTNLPVPAQSLSAMDSHEANSQQMTPREYERAKYLLTRPPASDRYEAEMRGMMDFRSDADFSCDTGQANLVRFLTR